MKVVNGSGAVQTSGFDWGCSHSGYERVAWDPTARKFVAVCKNDAATGSKSGRLAFAPGTTILPVDLNYNQLGTVMMAGGGGYWMIDSDIRTGQPPNANGLADIHLLHVASTSSPTPNQDITLVSDGLNDRAPHLAAYGSQPDGGRVGDVDRDGRLLADRRGPPDVAPDPRRDVRHAAAGATAASAGPLQPDAERARQPLPGLPRLSRRQRRLPGARHQRHEDQDPARPPLQLTGATAGSWSAT